MVVGLVVEGDELAGNAELTDGMIEIFEDRRSRHRAHNLLEIDRVDEKKQRPK